MGIKERKIKRKKKEKERGKSGKKKNHLFFNIGDFEFVQRLLKGS